jgi:predicted metal-dependent HD superfamily phosphohydrolase
MAGPKIHVAHGECLQFLLADRRGDGGNVSGLLFEAWARDIRAMRADAGVASDIFHDLMRRHGEPQRRYHHAGHLLALTELLDEHAPHISPGSAPRLAIWWHDAIYNPQARDNEERSSDLAGEHLTRLGAPTQLIEQTCTIILMTRNHWDGPSAGDGDYFLDADIAILGAPVATYDAYAADVRQEYAFAPDDLFRAGRSAFLESALARPRLFRTDVFEAAYAPQARANMQRELGQLTGPSP